MFKQNKLVIVTVAMITLCGCTKSERTEVPRRHAYPRVASNSGTYVGVDSVAMINFRVNTTAEISIKDKGCDIKYPQYGATVYLSVSGKYSDAKLFYKVWENRKERIERNIGSEKIFTSAVNNKAFEGVIITSHSVSQTPVQLLCADTEQGIIVSATAFFHNNIPSNAYDSIAPFYRAIYDDITKLGESLQCK